jgi:prolyl-tRNA editing enzyme YbaK/EbsC (Cys-tRNA(Pro) deacylase)
VKATCGDTVKINDSSSKSDHANAKVSLDEGHVPVKTLVWEGRATRRVYVTVLRQDSQVDVRRVRDAVGESVSMIKVERLRDVTMCGRGYVPPCVGRWMEGSRTIVDEGVGEWAGSRLETGECEFASQERDGEGVVVVTVPMKRQPTILPDL